MEKLEKFLQKFIGPFAKVMSENDTVQAVAEGFMRTGPVTFGVCLFVIIGNLPMTGYTDWLTSIGLYEHFNAISNASLNILVHLLSLML